MPTFQVILCVFSVTFVTGLFTVIVHTAFLLLPSFAVAVIVHTPCEITVTTPLLLTVATLGLLLVYVNVLFVAFAGAITVFNAVVVPLLRVSAFSIVIFVTGCFTITVQVAVLLLSSVVFAVIVQAPAPTAVITPLFVTVATFVLLLL